MNNGVFGKAVTSHDKAEGAVGSRDEVLLHPVYELVYPVGVTGTGGGVNVIADDVVWTTAIMPYPSGALACTERHEHDGGVLDANGKVGFAEVMGDGSDVVGVTEFFVMFEDIE